MEDQSVTFVQPLIERIAQDASVTNVILLLLVILLTIGNSIKDRRLYFLSKEISGALSESAASEADHTATFREMISAIDRLHNMVIALKDKIHESSR